MTKTYKPRKWKKAYKPKPKVSAAVKQYVKAETHRVAVDKKLYCTGGTFSLNNNVSTNDYAMIADLGVIPRYDPASTTLQEGSLSQARVKDNITLRHFNLCLYFHNKSAYNQFIRVAVLYNDNQYEQYATDGQNMCEDTTGTQVPYSTDLLQGLRLKLNTDLGKTASSFIFDKTYPLPYDGSQEGGDLSISYIRKLNLGKKIMKKLVYEIAPDDPSAVSPKGGKYIIFIWHIHGQGVVGGGNTLVGAEWRLEQYYEE